MRASVRSTKSANRCSTGVEERAPKDALTLLQPSPRVRPGSATTAGRRRHRPAHGNALTLDIRPGHVSDQISIRPDVSSDGGGSTLTADLLRSHLEGFGLRFDAACGMRHRPHVVPGDHAIERIVRRQHDVPIKPRAASLGRRMKGVHSSWRQLLYCRGNRWRCRRWLLRAGCGRDDHNTRSHGSGRCHFWNSPLSPIRCLPVWERTSGLCKSVQQRRISRRWRRFPPALSADRLRQKTEQ